MSNLGDRGGWLDRYATEASITSLIEGLINGTWPVSDWKHREHCVATAGLLMLKPELDLERELPGIIQRYNIAQGGRNTDSEGYHHTITLLYLEAIRNFIFGIPAGAGPVEICRQLLASPLGSKEYPLRYYSRSVLFSAEARTGWVAPDISRPCYLDE
jgi:hypothetical protein